MIIFEKFALTEDEIAFLKQQQAEAVERAVLRERCDQLQMRLQDSQIYGDRAVALVFDTFAQIRKLTGVDEDRTGSVAQILQSILEIWRRLHHEDAFQKGSPEHGFYVSMEDVVAAFALAQHRPDLGQDLLSRVREFKPIYPSVHDVLFACQTLWPRVVEGDDDLVEEISFNLQAFAQKYANSQGKPELADAFTSYLVGAAAVAECRLFDFCQHTDRVASAWERVLRDTERDTERGEEDSNFEFELSVFANGYAQAKGRADLGDAFCDALTKSCTVDNHIQEAVVVERADYVWWELLSANQESPFTEGSEE